MRPRASRWRAEPSPSGIKDANELLVSRNGDAGEVFRELLDAAEPRRRQAAVLSRAGGSTSPLRDENGRAAASSSSREGVTYHARVHSLLLGRLRATVKATKGEAFHIDTIDLYASRSRTEYAKRAAKTLGVEAEAVEAALLALVVEGEKAAEARHESEAAPRGDERSRAR